MKNDKFSTENRKRDHINLTINREVGFRNKTNGFENWDLIHCALPEINFSEVSTETKFLNKTISFPLIISSMTGGYEESTKINKILGEVAEKFKLPIGVGSQRQAIESSEFHNSFKIIRKVAPSVPIIGNIGAAEIANLKNVSSIKKLAELISADAFAVHLNPLQEFLQPEGNTNFAGVLNGIEKLVKELKIPIIVKEIGAGISKQVAIKLLNVGVNIIDIAGAGGTSWAGVEILRRKNKNSFNQFWDWGIPTSDALIEVASLKEKYPNLKIISSGGVCDGITMAKSIALGGNYFGVARPLIIELMKNGKNGIEELILNWKKEFSGAMFLVGAKNISELNKEKIKIL
ncbi:MAG: type 2 isopentenyl-diphosphate Delta-isomerase [Bacteroidota bacterium]